MSSRSTAVDWHEVRVRSVSPAPPHGKRGHTRKRDRFIFPNGRKAYFGIAEVLSPLRDIDKWVRRKLRCYLWNQWEPSGYRELRKRGVCVREVWHTSKSAHGQWWLSKTPALTIALPLRFLTKLGLLAVAPR